MHAAALGLSASLPLVLIRPFALALEPVLAGRILQVHYRRHINLVMPTTPKLSEPAAMNPRYFD
jgi:hypothetical protein